jgi:hypothetical protein
MEGADVLGFHFFYGFPNSVIFPLEIRDAFFKGFIQHFLVF